MNATITCKGTLILLLGIGCWLGTNAPSQGAGAQLDQIDKGLLRHAPRIMKNLSKKKYRCVGVLKFRVRHGNRKPSFRAGHLNTNLTTRLENALMLGSRTNSVRVIRNATQVAFRADRYANYRTTASRAKLFRTRYPLAVGGGSAYPDVFLTGIVKVGIRTVGGKETRDNRYTTVVIEAFDRGNPGRPWEESRFAVRTDRMVLADSGVGFRLTKSLLTGAGSRAPDTIVPTTTPIDPPGGGTTPGGTTPGGMGPIGMGEPSVSIQVLYSGTPKDLIPEAGEPKGLEKRFTVETPLVGDRVTLVLKNESTTKKFGVVLMVNGRNTLYEEQEAGPTEMSRWILDPGATTTVKGFYQVGDTSYKPFEVITKEDLMTKAPLDFYPAEKLGLITMHVLHEGDGSTALAYQSTGKGLRALGRGSRFGSLGSFKSAYFKELKRRRGKNYIVASGETQPTTLRDDKLNNPQHLETWIIRYFKDEGFTSGTTEGK